MYVIGCHRNFINSIGRSIAVCVMFISNTCEFNLVVMARDLFFVQQASFSLVPVTFCWSNFDLHCDVDILILCKTAHIKTCRVKSQIEPNFDCNAHIFMLFKEFSRMWNSIAKSNLLWRITFSLLFHFYFLSSAVAISRLKRIRFTVASCICAHILCSF